MLNLKSITAAAALAFVGSALAAPAEAQRGPRGGGPAYDNHRDYDRGRRGGRWNGPEGYFVVYARACPDLREDRRDRRYDYGRADRREDRRDRRVLECPPRAWEYVPSRREYRQGRDGRRLRPSVAYLDRRSQTYYVETRWGGVPVQIVRGRGYRNNRGYRHRYGYRNSGYGYRNADYSWNY